MIAGWFAGQQGETFPETLTLAGRRKTVLRYGENPHQEAAFYVSGEARPGVAGAEQVQGKALSYNNLNDTNAAFELVAEHKAPSVAIIKHANPCGVATGDSLLEAYQKALACDPVSAYGGIVALNRPLDAATAAAIIKLFVEVVIAPGLDEGCQGGDGDQEEPAAPDHRGPARSRGLRPGDDPAGRRLSGPDPRWGPDRPGRSPGGDPAPSPTSRSATTCSLPFALPSM